jgi:uncharacterized protein
MIDCDVHIAFDSAGVLLPYLDPYSRDYLERGERGAPNLPIAPRPWLHPEGYMRTDAIPSGGRVPGSDYDLMCEQLLDRFDIDYAILTGDDIIDVSTIANPIYAQALARAYNEWIAEHWLARDERLLGSIFVAPQDPVAAAAEIRRVAETHDRFCQVLLSSNAQRPYGDPFYRPIWEAASDAGIPIAIHLGGHSGINAAGMASGNPTFFWEFHALAAEGAMTHLASVLAHGIFERYQNTAFVIVELGVGWLPGILWRLDNNYKALRKETPWLQKLPSEYCREHVRLTTQPLESPDDPKQLHHVLEAIHGSEVLMFASDYPHWDFDDPTMLPLPKDWAEAVFDRNARALYKLPAARPKVLADGMESAK